MPCKPCFCTGEWGLLMDFAESPSFPAHLCFFYEAYEHKQHLYRYAQ